MAAFGVTAEAPTGVSRGSWRGPPSGRRLGSMSRGTATMRRLTFAIERRRALEGCFLLPMTSSLRSAPAKTLPRCDLIQRAPLGLFSVDLPAFEVRGSYCFGLESASTAADILFIPPMRFQGHLPISPDLDFKGLAF